MFQQVSVALPILLVEDDPILQLIDKLMLQSLGYRVEVVDKGLKALALHKKKAYAAILIDIDLPDLSDDKVLTMIRKCEKATKAIYPLITATAHGLLEEGSLLDKGADGYLMKPLSKDTLKIR